MNRHLYPQIRTIHVLSVIAVFAISAGILLAAQSGCIGVTLAGTDGSYDTPDTGLSEHAPVQAVTAWEGMSNLIVACQIADTFADMLFTGVLDAAYAVHAVLSLTAVDNITDTDSLELDGAVDITTFVSGSHTYAAVAASVDFGVQILDITNPTNITAADSIRDMGDGTPDLELRGARGITTFESGGHTYAAVAAYFSDSVQILNVTDPSDITAAGHITDIGTNTDDLELNGASGITTFVSGDHTYVAVAAHLDDGVQILNVTDPSNITAAGSITNTDTLELNGAYGITTFVSGGHTYVAVAAYLDSGVQILDVTDLSNITAAGSITNTDTLELNGAYGITTFVSGGHTYAAVAAEVDDGVQILNVTDPLHITPAGSIDTNTLKLNGARGITTFTSGDHTYVAVAAYLDSGVQILDVTDPLHITAAGNIADIGNNDDDLELNRAQGITTFTSGDHIYAAVAAYEDDGVQIIRIDIPPDTTPPADAFVTTWRTTSADESITLPLVGTDITINWGDGSTTAGVSTPVDHTYNTAGNYTVQITGGLTWFHLNNAADASKLVSLDQWGTASWASMENAFSGAFNMVYNAGDAPDLSGVTDMSNMFDSAAAFDGDLSSWDVSSVTDMNSMFSGASVFNQPLNDWNVSSVTDMYSMFFFASTFDGDISGWDVSSVTNMNSMFSSAFDFNQPLNDWNVSSVTDMSGMFFRASDFNQPLNDWNVSSVTDMHNMFAVARSFNQPLNDWDVSSVASMSNMFHIVSDFNQPLNDWNVSSVIDMNGMFHFASSFNQPLNDWDVSSVASMSGMFFHASDFNQPLNDWDVSSVSEMGNMFIGTSSFNQNLGNWYVVANATSIAKADVPGVVAEISAQNDRLNGHNPTYGISRYNDYAFFEIVNGNKINMTSVGTKSSYRVNVTASGSNVFESGNNWRILNVTVTEGVTNAVPELNSIGSQSVSELQSLTFTATATDANSGDTLTFSLTGTPPTGATITDDGVFTWTPTESQDGDHTITVQVTDGSLTDSETLTVTVNEVNVAPVLNTIDDQTVNELVELTFTATASDTDVVDNVVNTLIFSFDGTFPSGAAITDDGNFTWIPTESQVGSHDITVQVTDGSLTDSETLTVTVCDVNVAPVLNTIDDQTVNEFVELTFTATASDDDSLTFSFDGTVPSGAAITDDGNFTWTPTESQDGDHTITVQVTDGSLTDSETLTVTVNEVNVAPVLNTIDDQTVNELVELTFTATASDTDVVDNVVNTLIFSFDGTVPSGAAITSAGVFTWTPTESQVGSHDITVQVTDGSLTDSETLTVTVRDVNVAPVLNTIDDQTVNEFVELTFTATASDDDSLTFSFDGTVPSGAAITDDGNFTWTPTESQDGDHTITVQVTDGSLTDSETLTVTVNEVNVAPVLNTIDDQTVNELVELTFTATASDTDVVDNVVNTLIFSFDGTVPSGAAITSAGVFTWTPTESQVGSHDITVQVTDGSLTDSETLTVTVRDVNVAPVLNTIDDQTVNEFVELTFTATASDDDSLTFSFDGTVPSGAAITSAGVFTWTPTESQDGDHTITVQVTDGSLTDSETLTVTVNEVNVAPVLNTIDDQTVNELVELTFTATASDTDVVDNVVNTLIFSFDGTVPSGAAITSAGVFTWIPTELQVGSHDITVQVTDGSLTDSETLTVTVRDVNVAPVLNTIDDQTVNEFVELTFTATASDDDSLIFSFDGTVPSGAAITSAGVFTWTPTESQDGDHTITVQVTDGSLTDSETLTVTVNEVNVAPVLNTIDDQTVNELVELTFTATASDTDVVDNVVNTLIFSFDGTVPSGAAITDDGNFTWTPTESQVGSHDITVQVTDGSLTDSETLTVTVRDVNVAPVLNTIDDQTVNEFVELTFTATASDDDTLIFSLDGTVPSGAAITDDGNFTWTPTESQDGDHTITVQVTDGSLTDSETLTVTVNEVNVAPVLNAIGDKGTSELVELTFTATASDTDVVDNLVNTLTFSFDGTVPSGAAITSAGVFTWIPTESQVGSHDITVQVTDGSLTDSETLTVTVRDVNVAPVLNTIDDQTVNEFVELTFTATASDDDTLIFSLDGTVPSGAAITDDGNFTWTPTESQDGDHTITVQVTDGSLTDSETLTVTVNEVNVAPVLNAIGDKGTSELVELTFTATASDTDVVDNLVNTLTFSFDGTVPSGAAITSAGVFTWTPTESQDGDHTITVQVTDGSLTDSETLTVTVNEVNVAPVLNAIGDKGTSKLVELTFTATASDTDVVDRLVNTLTFSFDGTFPSGAAITSAGVFTWTPTESQVGSHDITVQVTDGSLTDSETLTVTVKDTTAPRRITLSADAFITTWRTDSANQTITIPVGGSTARYSIDWGDNSPAETDITGDSTHTYREADSYTVSISGGLERFHLDGQQPNAGRLASIEQWGDTRWITMDAAFDGATNMVYRATDTPDLSGVTDMHRMFGDATAFNGDLSSWDVSKVTDMSDMFIFATAFNGDLSSWDVSSVTNMNEMFAVATSFNQPLNSWNVSRVTNMDDMFYFATAFSQNLGNWYVVANATSIARADVPGVVAEISAQNGHLNGHNPTYSIGSDNDYTFFEIVNGNKINMTSVGTKSSYKVNVTASGSNVFEDGNNWRMLVVRVTGDNNADLGGLTISSGTLSPPFSSSDITYTASVDNSVTQVTVTPTASDSSATITVNGNTVTSGTGYIVIGLTVDEPNTVTVIVTAQDSTTKTYIITLTRTASLSDNADLGGLTISSGTLSPPFSSSDITYTASVDNSVTQVTVTPTASDSSATITVNGNTVTSGTGYIVIGLTVDEPNTVTVIVTAQDSTTKTYIITLTRTASLSDNADLGGLTISSGTLSPQFSSSDITYTASVDSSVTQVTVTPTASDSSATITVNGNTVTSGTGYILTGLTVGTTTVTIIVTAQDFTTKTYIITVTVRDVPITVSSAAYNPGNGQLTITFNQDIATVDYSGLHVRSSADPDTGGITLSSVTGADYSGRTITATLDSEQQDQYDALQSPHLVVEDGAVTDTDGDQTTDVPPQPIRDASQKGSSSSSKAPIVHINMLAQSRLVDIPPHIAEQVASHDASDPLEPIIPDDTFDLPLVINGYGYLLDAYENTLIPQTVTAGDNPVHITFTVYTEKELAHFILYLNLQGRNTNYADSDTYITYKDDGTTSVTDPHGYIGSATVTVTQEDDSIPEKRTVRITIEFGEEPMGPTNMVAYMWNTDREALFVKIIDALEVVVASPESAMQAADPEPLEPDSVLPADPEPVTPDFADDAADPEPVPYDILGPDDYDDTQILQIIRMWSGFESESITDEQLLELLGLDDHQGADIPDWMMTELGVLVAKGTVTVDEFLVALQYVLEHD